MSKAQEAICQYIQVQGYVQVASKPESTFARNVLVECEKQLASGQLKEIPTIGNVRTFQGVTSCEDTST